MSRRNRHEATSSTKESDSFRGLIDKRISVDEYVKNLDQRVHDRENREERPSRDRAVTEPHRAAAGR